MAIRPLGSLRQLASKLRDDLDRRFHGRRRSQALQGLKSRPRPRRYLVLCYGNICRSPYAARLLRARLAQAQIEAEVIEGGFYGPDRPSPEVATAVAAERGLVSLADHRSRLVTADDARQADLIVVMEADHVRRLADMNLGSGPILMLGDLDPAPIDRRRITDPYGGPPATFHHAYERLERCVDALVKVVGEI